MLNRILKTLACVALVALVVLRSANPAAALTLPTSVTITHSYTTPHLAFIGPLVTELLAGWGAEAAATSAIEAAGATAARSAATEAADLAATFRAAAGTAGGFEIALAGSMRVDAAVLKNAIDIGSGLMFADLTARDLYGVYTAYKEAKATSGKPLDPCTPITIHPEGSDRSFTVFDSETCPSLQ